MRKDAHTGQHTQTSEQWRPGKPGVSGLCPDKYIPSRRGCEESWEEDTEHAAFLVCGENNENPIHHNRGFGRGV